VHAPADTKANPGKITMASPFSVRPPVAPTNLEELKQRDQQLEPLCAKQRKALEIKREIEIPATTGANLINIIDTIIVNS
jgi:hypothetical protein